MSPRIITVLFWFCVGMALIDAILILVMGTTGLPSGWFVFALVVNAIGLLLTIFNCPGPSLNLEGMLLSARWLSNVRSVNDWDYVDKVEFSEGDPVTVYLQLLDASRDKGTDFKVNGRRYVPAAGATLTCTVANLDDAKTYIKNATQVYATLDASIWSFTVAAADAVKGTPNVLLTLTEGAVVRRALIKAPLRVYPTSGV